MTWSYEQHLNADPLPWLLEPDLESPGPRLFTLLDVLGREPNDPEVLEARRAVMQTGPVPTILAAQEADGYWAKPGPGYGPKYRGTTWQVIFLGQLGADTSDARVTLACDYALDNGRSPMGGFSYTGKNSGHIHCVQGNACGALVDLGYLGDPRLEQALDWLARSVTGDGIALAQKRKQKRAVKDVRRLTAKDVAKAKKKPPEVRYLRSGNSGPGFACSANGHLPCAWGGIKALHALSRVPQNARTPAMRAAIGAGCEFLLAHDIAAAAYPMGYNDKPNRSWFKFGYPIGYVTDVLQNLETLTALGYGGDPRLSTAIRLVLDKQDERGRWPLEYTYNGKTWAEIETKGKPSKWVTMRALRVLRRITVNPFVESDAGTS